MGLGTDRWLLGQPLKGQFRKVVVPNLLKENCPAGVFVFE